MKILVTGGLGFIGSHTVVELLDNNYDVVVIDNLYNSNIDVVKKIEAITNKKFKFYQGDVCDKEFLRTIFNDEKISAVIHFAGYKAVGESVEKPIMYYENNLLSTLHLCEVMQEFDCNTIIFSSSATVYGTPKKLPITEDMEVGNTTNPYGTSKYMNEIILRDICYSNPNFKAIVLRYFNPIGAHKSGLLGEIPNGIPNNLMPYIVRVATGELEYLRIFGNDYDTHDGTGVRDYIHVVDLAKGHIKALDSSNKLKGISYFNLGTGVGYSVLDIVNAFEKENGVKNPYKIVERRSGDIDCCFADCSKAYNELGWRAELGIEEMVRDAYKFVLNQNK